jgi:hypothetical protein
MATGNVRTDSMMPLLDPYLARLNASTIVWMSGKELGMTEAREQEVFLWPYSHETFEEMALTLTHEVVHRVRPELQEGATWAVAHSLMDRSRWKIAVYSKLANALLNGLKALRRRKRSELG